MYVCVRMYVYVLLNKQKRIIFENWGEKLYVTLHAKAHTATNTNAIYVTDDNDVGWLNSTKVELLPKFRTVKICMSAIVCVLCICMCMYAFKSTS